MHTGDLFDIAAVVTAALILGLLLQRLRQPAIVGYIIAGAVLGPSGLELIGDREAVSLLAELGVLLLLFVIGMELSLRGFRRVYRVAILGCGLQVAVSVGVMLLLSYAFAWPTSLAIVMGFVGALSSTAVAFKILEDIGELRTDVGRTAVGVLIAQDLAVVPMLLVIDGFAGGGASATSAAVKVLIAMVLLVVMIAYLTRRERVNLPFMRSIGENVELTAIVALAFCFVASLLSAMFGLSPAYGAFLAGLWIGNSHGRAQVLAAAMPIQSVLLMVFFLSIGMLLDVRFIWHNLLPVLVLLAVVTLGKTVLNVGILRLAGEPWPRAWLAGMVIGQLGEFSFLLMAVGATAGLLTPDHEKLLTALIALSLMTSPFWLFMERRLHSLATHRINGFRRALRMVYRGEIHAVAAASNQVVAHASDVVRLSLRLSEGGLEAYQRYRQRHAATAEPEPEADLRDVAFDIEIPAEDAARETRDRT